MQRLLARGEKRQIKAATALLRLAAKQRNLPFEYSSGGRLRIGDGCRQREFLSSISSATKVGAAHLALDKHETYRRLSELGLPVAPQIRVRSLADALEAVGALGFPAVLKPLKGSKGRGVTADIRSAMEVGPAFERASAVSRNVLVERFVEGSEYRLLVVGGRMIAAGNRRVPKVTGDGRTTVRELIEEQNRDPRRNGFPIVPLRIDDEMERMLEGAGYSLDSILEDCRTIPLRSTSNVSTGGVPIDVTDRVHPDNRDMAERAVAAIGLDIAGVDFITTDIARSYRNVGGSIIEINSRPGLGMHAFPYEGEQRQVANEILEMAFPGTILG